MSRRERALIRAGLRQDLALFVHRCFQTLEPRIVFSPNWHHDALIYEIDQVLSGENEFLIVNVPPRHLKSIMVSVALPAYLLGLDPTWRILCASYAIDLAEKHSRDCRTVMESDWYKALFPKTRINPRKNTALEYETTERGYRLATSVGGTLTGRGGDLIIIDDPLKADDASSETKRSGANEWFDSSLLSRRDGRGRGGIIIVAQRLHCDDLVGHVLERDPYWRVLSLPAIADEPQEVKIGRGLIHRREAGDVLHPALWSREALEATKRLQGSITFSAQYQQAPVPPGGAIVHREWFREYDERPRRHEFDQIVQSWDMASKAKPTNDYSVCTTWLIRNRDYYLLNVWRGRLEFPGLKQMVISQAQAHNARRVLIEDAGAGTGIIQELKYDGRPRAIPIRAERDKRIRLEASTALIEAGHVWIPSEATWLADFLNELLAFPNGKYDDQVDSFSQFLIWVRDRPRVTVA